MHKQTFKHTNTSKQTHTNACTQENETQSNLIHTQTHKNTHTQTHTLHTRPIRNPDSQKIEILQINTHTIT